MKLFLTWYYCEYLQKVAIISGFSRITLVRDMGNEHGRIRSKTSRSRRSSADPSRRFSDVQAKNDHGHSVTSCFSGHCASGRKEGIPYSPSVPTPPTLPPADPAPSVTLSAQDIEACFSRAPAFTYGSPRCRRNPFGVTQSFERIVSDRPSNQSPEIKLSEAPQERTALLRLDFLPSSNPLPINGNPGAKMDFLQVPNTGNLGPCLTPSLSLPESESVRVSPNRFSFSLSLSVDVAEGQNIPSRRSSIGSPSRPPLRRHSAIDTPDSPPLRPAFPKPLEPPTATDTPTEPSPSTIRPRTSSATYRSQGSHSTESAPSSTVISKRRNSPVINRRDKYKNKANAPTSRSFDSSAGQMLVRHVWNRMMASKGSVTIGQDLFQRMYFTRPDIRSTLRTTCTNLKINNFGGFQKTHAKAVADLLDACIKGDLDQDGLLLLVEKCGKAHSGSMFENFRNDFWETFGEAILWCSLEWGNRNQRTEESRKVWMDIIHFLVDNLKHFYTEERRPRLRRSVSPGNTTSTES